MWKKYIFKETKCTLFSKTTLLTMLLTILFSLSSIYISNNYFLQATLSINSGTLLTETILFPAKLSAVFGATFFAVLTVLELDKIKKYNVSMLLQPYISNVKLFICKIITQIIIAFITISLLLLIMFPYYFFTTQNINTLNLYILSYYVITFCSVVCSILISSGIYLITQHKVLAYIITFFSFFFSFSAGAVLNYLFSWIQSPVTGYSENFGNSIVIKALFGNRAFCILLSTSIFLLGLLCTRCYEKGIFKSIFINSKKHFLVPSFFVLCILSSISLYAYDPVFKSVTPLDAIAIMFNKNFSKYTNNEIKTILEANVDLTIKNENGFVSGIFKQTLANNTSQNNNLYFTIAPGYKVDYVKVDRNDIPFNLLKGTNATTRVYDFVKIGIPTSDKFELEISYSGSPKVQSIVNDFSIGGTKDYVYYGKNQLIPNILVKHDVDTVKGTINISSDLEVATTGDKNTKLSNHSDGTTTWSFADNKSDNMYLCAAKYETIKMDIDSLSIEFYYPKNKSKLFTGRKDDIIEMVKYFSNTIGPLKLNNYPFKIITTSGVSGARASSSENIIHITEDCLNQEKRKMENSNQTTGNDMFSLLAHEISHEWWGIGINISSSADESNLDKLKTAWTSEGLAEFSTYMFLKYRYGQAYADKLLLSHWEFEANNLNKDFYTKHPEYLEKLPSIQRWLVTIDTKNSFIYKKCPFEIYKIYNLIGEEKFVEGLKNIYLNYYQQSDKTLTFTRFLNEMGIVNE